MKNTWGRHCDKLIFMSSQEDKELGAVALNISEGRQKLWGKTKQGFKYVYENHWDDADWFMKADDDTFVVVENLRNLLKDYDTNDPISFGHNFKYLGVSTPFFLCYLKSFSSGLFLWWCRLCSFKRVTEKIRHHRTQLFTLQAG